MGGGGGGPPAALLLLTVLLRQYASSSRLASGLPALAAKNLHLFRHGALALLLWAGGCRLFYYWLLRQNPGAADLDPAFLVVFALLALGLALMGATVIQRPVMWLLARPWRRWLKAGPTWKIVFRKSGLEDGL